MLYLKRLSAAAALVALCALCFGISAANADWILPTGVYDHSRTTDNSCISAKSIDGDLATFGKWQDDSGSLDDLPCTGYVIYDLGARQEVDGFKFWARNASSAVNPKDVDFFYWANEALKPADGYKPNSSDQIALDGNAVVAASRTLPEVVSNNSYQVDFSSLEKFTARYVGIRFNNGYDTPSNVANQMAEVQFNTTTITPEPGALVILVTGLIGLACYAWRKGK
jgi:hypothetical protein